MIVATAAGDARIESFGLDFEDGAGVVVETACEFWADADFDAVVERRRCFDDNAKFANGIHRIFVTGNMELQLDRSLANKRIFPAVSLTSRRLKSFCALSGAMPR